MIELTKATLDKLYSKGLLQEELELLFPEEFEFSLELLQTQGLKLEKQGNKYKPALFSQRIEDTTFCIVDIETNGSKFDTHQVIEIGALKIKNGKILDGFNTLLYCEELPTAISNLTGITLDQLLKAPSVKEVMHNFKLFLSDHVFVAHALHFDYHFISEMFERTGLGKMYNVGLCTIKLAERTISSAKYGLNYLNETLHLEENFQQHRAYNDALITLKLFEISLKHLPKNAKSMKNLLDFSLTGKKMPRAPLIEKETLD